MLNRLSNGVAFIGSYFYRATPIKKESEDKNEKKLDSKPTVLTTGQLSQKLSGDNSETNPNDNKQDQQNNNQNNVDPNPTPEPEDPNKSSLERLRENYQTMSERFATELTKWEQKKIKVIVSDSANEQSISTQPISLLHKESRLAKFLENVKAFLKKAEEYTRSAEGEIEKLKEELDTELKEIVSDHIANCKKLKELEQNKGDIEEQKQLALKICTESMEILNEFIVFLGSVDGEIQYCVNAEKVSVAVLAEVLQVIWDQFIHLPFPNVDLNLDSYYQTYLYNEIHVKTDEVTQELTDTEGELVIADSLVEKYLDEKKQPENGVSATKSSKVFVRSASDVKKFPSYPEINEKMEEEKKLKEGIQKDSLVSNIWLNGPTSPKGQRLKEHLTKMGSESSLEKKSEEQKERRPTL